MVRLPYEFKRVAKECTTIFTLQCTLYTTLCKVNTVQIVTFDFRNGRIMNIC